MIWFIIGLVMARVHFINAKIEAKVVKGVPVHIKDYGYSANFIVLGKEKFLCGASIINQNTILTAAHCLEDLTENTKVLVTMGHHNRKKGNAYQMKAAKLHEEYNSDTLHNDIALIHLAQDIPLGKHMYRIALSRVTPKEGVIAEIAGWGIINDEPRNKSKLLHLTKQEIWPIKRCHSVIPDAPPKTFCAGDLNAVSYPAQGDSGSALVADNYLQIGIVSFKKRMYRSVIVYTDVSYYQNWIEKYTIRLKCDNLKIDFLNRLYKT